MTIARLYLKYSLIYFKKSLNLVKVLNEIVVIHVIEKNTDLKCQAKTRKY